MHEQSVLDYLVYLERDCAGEDRHEFWTPAGEPDLVSARNFAEAMRIRLAGFLGDEVRIEQRVNIVRVSMIIESCPTAA